MFFRFNSLWFYVFVFLIFNKITSQLLLLRCRLGQLVDPKGFQNVQFPQQLVLLGLRHLASLQTEQTLGLLLDKVIAQLPDLAHIQQIGLGALLLLGILHLLLPALEDLDEGFLLLIGEIGIVLQPVIEVLDAAIAAYIEIGIAAHKGL